MPETLATNALTTLARVKAELAIDASTTTHDDYLTLQINFASQAIESFLDRQLQRVVDTVERVQGYGGNRVTLTRTPLESVTSAQIINGTAPFSPIDVSELTIENADAGFLYLRTGFPWAVPRPFGTVARDPLPGHEEKVIEVTYTGGYVLPNDGGTQTLPIDIERACILAVVSAFEQRGRDRDISEEQLMSYRVRYGGSSQLASVVAAFPSSPFSSHVTRLLLPYRRIPCA